ncbi:unnamed protein product [Rotaria sordida]|uniref:Opioid growth factor receptor (OGFr) conserved domain-containing protein n=1 Tax=Rotaria sordida TaxID=392033 RepID=A0A818LP50_9BILA|nr:unnamed protein product [Rotaria sordida]CAF3579183.1 unnamed protein product [Rotaria sordida]
MVDHRYELRRKLSEITSTCDLLRQSLKEQRFQSRKHSLIEQIDQWERDSINKIQQTAKETKQLLFRHTAKHNAEIEIQLEKLTNQLRQSSQIDDIREIDLSRWTKELAQLTEVLYKPPHINVREDLTPFVTKIIVDVQREETTIPNHGQHTPDKSYKTEIRSDEAQRNENNFNQQRSSINTRSIISSTNCRITFDDSDDEDASNYFSWAQSDIIAYRNNYPNVRSDPNITQNYRFYTNQIPSYPDGDFIDKIHEIWFRDYDRLEFHHGYTQWLFPLQERGLNWYIEPLQKHEIELIKKDEKALKRILTSYKLMLDFYGFKLIDEKTGEIDRLYGDSYKSRFHNLNTSSHNYLRITRILKCLGEFDYEHLKFPFLEQILREIIIENTLPNCLQSCKDYWIETLRSRDERRAIRQYARELIEYRNKGSYPSKSLRAIRPSITKTTTTAI